MAVICLGLNVLIGLLADLWASTLRIVSLALYRLINIKILFHLPKGHNILQWNYLNYIEQLFV